MDTGTIEFIVIVIAWAFSVFVTIIGNEVEI